jgi:hypothetical protein
VRRGACSVRAAAGTDATRPALIVATRGSYAHPVTTDVGIVTADYGQIELHPGHGGAVAGLDGTPSLAWTAEGATVVLTVARQFGDVPVEVLVAEAEPEADPSWDAAVELSVRTGEATAVHGWGGEGEVPVPVPAGVDVRVRYAVADGQQGADQFEEDDEASPLERYVVQVWPAPPAPPRLVVASQPWSQYWAFGADAATVVASLADVPDPERLTVLVDRALATHPDVRERLRAGEGQFRTGILRYVQELFRVTHGQGVYETLRQDHQALGELISERAGA